MCADSTIHISWLQISKAGECADIHRYSRQKAYQVGIVIKSLRSQRKLTKEGLAAELGISESTIKKYENGERALSITNLFKIIDYFKVDANTILNVAESKKETSIDSRLELMDCSKKAYYQKIFNEMLDNAEMLVSQEVWL